MTPLERDELTRDLETVSDGDADAQLQIYRLADIIKRLLTLIPIQEDRNEN